MEASKGWEWEKANHAAWLEPADDVYYLAHKWSSLGYKRILDLGSGLGRHSIYFAKQGFDVYSIDISEYAIDFLKSWRDKEKLNIDVRLGDIVSLPYENDSFDCVFAYHSISHADTYGMKRIVSEIERVLRSGGEIYASIRSKESEEFSKSGYPKLDENTVIHMEDGPEMNVPHFYVDREDLLCLFGDFFVERIRHIDYCYLYSSKLDCKHYYINGKKK